MSSDEAEESLTTTTNLPSASKKKYESVYKAFLDWHSLNNMSLFTENVLLCYFSELAEKYKSTTLWVHYSMLRSTLLINKSINIEKFTKLRSFLKRKSQGYRPKKSKAFSNEEIQKFMTEAPEIKYLATKVALVMGSMGACRMKEMREMSVKDFEDIGTAVIVTVPDTKTNMSVRKFTITDIYYEIWKRYYNLRPPNTNHDAFFLKYHRGRYTTQRIGKNKFCEMGKEIAMFLNLPNPQSYTGLCFRRSSEISAPKNHHLKQSNLLIANSVIIINNITMTSPDSNFYSTNGNPTINSGSQIIDVPELVLIKGEPTQEPFHIKDEPVQEESEEHIYIKEEPEEAIYFKEEPDEQINIKQEEPIHFKEEPLI
ncbi:unnamed protein product [Brassicogethes aeneus]|uniref:Tyr recombinase domain-containing protein n=1 Tax=Brassicogethes aeneus TaxID=1431903 RepID=A0A9P0FF38_BRAAE|nr:unnamed protein product [Brassicogethes aeneus]